MDESGALPLESVASRRRLGRGGWGAIWWFSFRCLTAQLKTTNPFRYVHTCACAVSGIRYRMDTGTGTSMVEDVNCGSTIFYYLAQCL